MVNHHMITFRRDQIDRVRGAIYCAKSWSTLSTTEEKVSRVIQHAADAINLVPTNIVTSILMV